jgi:beta-galactosidase/beta-glucuronidase
LPFAAPDPAAVWTASGQPARVTVDPTSDGYVYQVNGQVDVIRGMGYNPPVEHLGREARQARLERDLGLMRAAGVNTLIGWNPAAIDALTLDVAQAHGIGVALPFDVDFRLDFRDEANRGRFRDAVLSWVDQYGQHPALRIWAIGNEVLQRSVPPSWCSTPPTPDSAARAEAWAGLLVEVADLVHAHDPLHPIMYRDAEDAYLSWIARALEERPAERPWLIYGTNAYTERLVEILDGWPARAPRMPLVVSEFAPLDAARGQRADLLREQWLAIRSRRAYVLGGAVYVWSTDGPEEVDRSFGLVDEAGQPVDDALDTIAALYRADADDNLADAGRQSTAADGMP